MAKLNVVKYSVKEWADMECMEVSELVEEFEKEPVAFYADDDSAVAGVQYSDGTYGCFGCRMDRNGLTYDGMMSVIERGL